MVVKDILNHCGSQVNLLYLTCKTEGQFARVVSAILSLPLHFIFFFLSTKREDKEKDVCVQTELFVYSTFEVYSILLYSCFKVY